MAPSERLGELEARARVGRILIDLVVEDAEAIGLPLFLIRRPHGQIVHKPKAGVIGVERGAPRFALRKDRAELRQSEGGLRFVGGLEVSEIGGRRCRLQNVVGIARRNFRARISKPARRIVRVNGDQPGESLKHALRIALGEGCSSSLAQRVWGLIRQIIAVLRHLRREPNAIVGEIGVAIIALQGFGAAGDSENQHETQEPQRPRA
ncbi:MAG: hypothetical protein WDN29_00380 [Methylovirgula sp.]